MKKSAAKKCFAVLSALVLLLSAACCAAAEDTPHYTLPVDFSPGMPVNQKYYLSDTVYEDPTIKVVITSDSYNGVLYWVADIEIADASQLRTAVPEELDSEASEFGPVLARRMNAVLAINGDYYWYGSGTAPVTIRQGDFYQEHWEKPRQDILVIDEDGDFHGISDPKTMQGLREIDGKKIINAFCFGPLLVKDGKISNKKPPAEVPPDQFSQRVAIAQIDHLKYRVIVSGPNKRGSKAFKFEAWRKFIASMEDIQIAYNLDGGDSSVLVFNGVKINDPGNENERQLGDIIYFASAWPGD